jgi:DNA polymerase III alpha subunit (gram-positive type)
MPRKCYYFFFGSLLNVSVVLAMEITSMKDDSLQIKKCVVIALDVETSGPNFTTNSLISIGVSVQDMEMNEIASFQRNLAIEEGRYFDERCLNDFWRKHDEAFRFVTSNTSDPKVVMEDLSAFVSDIETTYPSCVIVSDNPSFDIAWINLYFSRYTERLPINYHTNGKHRMIWDSSSVQKTWCGFKKGVSFSYIPLKYEAVLRLSSPIVHDHNPLNDAREIASFFIQTWKQMEEFDTQCSD